MSSWPKKKKSISGIRTNWTVAIIKVRTIKVNVIQLQAFVKCYKWVYEKCDIVKAFQEIVMIYTVPTVPTVMIYTLNKLVNATEKLARIENKHEKE